MGAYADDESDVPSRTSGHPRKGRMRRASRGWDLCFFLVASQRRRFVVMATSGRYFFHHLVVVLFGEGTMRRTERGWDPSFFWQFVNDAHGSSDRLERVVPLVIPAVSTRSSLPFLLAALPAAFFIALLHPQRPALGGGDRTRSGPHHLF